MNSKAAQPEHTLLHALPAMHGCIRARRKPLPHGTLLACAVQVIEWMQNPVPASKMAGWLKCRPVDLKPPGERWGEAGAPRC